MVVLRFDAVPYASQDPFSMSVHKAVWGTKDKPTVVPSMYEERLVGCICEFIPCCCALIGNLMVNAMASTECSKYLHA